MLITGNEELLSPSNIFEAAYVMSLRRAIAVVTLFSRSSENSLLLLPRPSTH